MQQPSVLEQGRGSSAMQDVDVPAIPAGGTALITEPGEHFFESSSPTGLNRFLQRDLS